MSTAHASGATAVPRPAEGARPRLTLVGEVWAAPRRAPFVVLVGVLLTAGLLSLLMLNTVLSQDAFVAHDLEARSALLADREEALERQLAVAESPPRLARRAAALGMVPNENPVFIRTSDGAVLGEPTPAPTPPPPATPAQADAAGADARR